MSAVIEVRAAELASATEPKADDKHELSNVATEFSTNDKGVIYQSQENIEIALHKLAVRLRFNELAGHPIITTRDEQPARLDDAKLIQIWLLIDRRFGFRPTKEFFSDVLGNIARSNAFNPVLDYLGGLKWDGISRAKNWLSAYSQAPDNAYTRAVGRIMLTAAVRRAKHPGVKFDEMVIFEGKQGSNKSTALQVLAVNDAWFSDSLQLGNDTKRQMESTQGKWICEAGELKGMSNGDVRDLKAYLSRSVDEARLAYGRLVTVAPRRFVIVGTTNEVEGYLRDSTGNRRFWPVNVGAFDIEALRRDRDQLWAEAVQIEASEASIRLDPELWEVAAVEQEAREQLNPFEELLAKALGEIHGRIWVLDVYYILGLEPEKITQQQQTQIGTAMRKLGWDKKKLKRDRANKSCYWRGDDHPIELSGLAPFRLASGVHH